MNKRNRIALVLGLSLAAVLVLMIAAIATAASVTPTEVPGNAPAGYDLQVTGSGVYPIPGHPGLTITVTVSAHQPNGQELAFTSQYPVLKVHMKGGDNYNVYDYSPNGTYSDSGLVCPPTSSSTTTSTSTTSTTEAPTSTTSSSTTTTVGGLTSTTGGPSTSTTVGDLTTVSLIQTGGGGTVGPGPGVYALGMLALALFGGLAWTMLRPTRR